MATLCFSGSKEGPIANGTIMIGVCPQPATISAIYVSMKTATTGDATASLQVANGADEVSCLASALALTAANFTENDLAVAGTLHGTVANILLAAGDQLKAVISAHDNGTGTIGSTVSVTVQVETTED